MHARYVLVNCNKVACATLPLTVPYMYVCVMDSILCLATYVLIRIAYIYSNVCTYSTAQFKLDAREYILASASTFSPSSQPMLASKGSMLSSKGNMLSCMILLAIKVDACVQLLAHIRHRAVSRCAQARLHALVHYFICNLPVNLMLTGITHQAFIKCLLAILIHKQ